MLSYDIGTEAFVSRAKKSTIEIPETTRVKSFSSSRYCTQRERERERERETQSDRAESTHKRELNQHTGELISARNM